MDVEGPLSKSAWGHVYILPVMNFVTCYPEVVLLSKATSKNITRKMVLLFSCMVLLKELLKDQGMPFFSKLMSDVCQLLQVKQLYTSVYHPQMDGLAERFKQTLKRMLRHIVDEGGQNWDLILPEILFAIWETPQASTGFTPFELLFGRRPQGLLYVTKEAWKEQPFPLQTN